MRLLICPLCRSERVRSADVTEAVIVAVCIGCGAQLTIQHKDGPELAAEELRKKIKLLR